MASDKTERVIAARMKLRDRFLARMEQSPAVSDAEPMGEGPPNRHGMPKLPPQQKASRKWPVLDLGIHPEVSVDDWRLRVSGSCDQPLSLSWEALLGFEQVDDVSDFHCVTGWSRLDIEWKGVRLSDILAAVQPRAKARYLYWRCHDGYTTNFPLEEALKNDVLLVHTANGKPLSKEHGGPVRVITPQLWAWKAAKWVKEIVILDADQPGYWEQRGYSNTAHPWRDDRYSR